MFFGINWETFQHSTLKRLFASVYLFDDCGWMGEQKSSPSLPDFGFPILVHLLFETWLGKLVQGKIDLCFTNHILSLFFILVDTYFHLIFSSSGTYLSRIENFKKIGRSGDIYMFSLLQKRPRSFIASPIFGLGPERLFGIEYPFVGSEAHNSLLDWLISSGIIGLTALLVLLIFASVRLLREKQWELLMALGALFIFGQAHHVLRHPLVWCIFTLALLAVSKKDKSIRL